MSFCSVMAYSVSDKVALVTGGAGGIGASIVKLFLDHGAKHIVILDIAKEAGIALQNDLNAKYKDNITTFIQCDVTDKKKLLEAFKTVQDEIGYIDLVINNAGIFDETPESYEKEININLVALITSSLHAWKLMHKEKGGMGGTIINVSSTTALGKFTYVPIYGATKAAVIKFSTTLGCEVNYTRSGVRVVTMCFGVTDTSLIKDCNAKVFDQSFQEQVARYLTATKVQSSESAAKAVIHAYEQGASGSVWLSLNDETATDITNLMDKSVELFDGLI